MQVLDAANEIIPDQQKLREDEVPILIEPDTCVRFKVTPKCPWSCSFCHEEGGWDNLLTARWDERLEKAFQHLYEIGYREVHFTGGEPTVNSHLPDIIRGLKSIGYMVRTTSVLAAGSDAIQKIVDAGLDGVNVSLHENFSAVDVGSKSVPERVSLRIAGMQTDVGVSQARRQILNLVNGLGILKDGGVDVKANTVVTSEDDIPRMMDIYQYAKTHGIKLRFLGDLTPNNVKNSRGAIKKLLEMIGVKLKKISHKKGTADITVYFKDVDGYEFGVKTIADVFLDTMCRDCKVRDEGNCTEKYYGLRLETRADPDTRESAVYIRLCLHKGDADTFMKFDDFLSSPQFSEIVGASL